MPRKRKPTTWWRGGVLHIETTHGIVNIRPNLTDRHGRSVDSIEILADDGIKTTPKVCNVRLIKLKRKPRKKMKKKPKKKTKGFDSQSYIMG